MITQLAHINFFSDRHKEMVDFYIHKLGLKVAFTLDDDCGEPFGWYVDCGKMTFIEIFNQAGAVKQWGGKVEELKSGSRYRHLCFEVKELENYRKALLANGVDVTPVTVGMDNSKQAWIKDPDGNAIELMEYTSSSYQTGGKK